MDGSGKLKVGVWQGDGAPPGYEWNVGLIHFVRDEAREFLSEGQYAHMSLQVKELASQPDPTHSDTISLDKIEGFFELRDKGGPLGGLNVRLFFGVDSDRRSIIVLGVIKKQNNGPTPTGDKVRMRRRWRKYLSGDYGYLPER